MDNIISIVPPPKATSSLPGPKILIEGPAGTGKTHSIGTLVDWAQAHHKEVFVLFTEQGLESLLGYWTDRNLPIPEALHYHVQLTRSIGLAALTKAAEDVGKMSYDLITKMQDPNRSGDNNSFWLILKVCADFPDDRTGKTFGAIDKWDTDKIFVIDSLSELANAAFRMVIGAKPTASQPDFGVAQNNTLNFIRLCTQATRCTFVMTAHVQRQVDEITGSIRLMTKVIGKALADEVPQLFSDVIYTVREGTSFYWETAMTGVDTKSRNLPIASKQPQDFAVIMAKWQSRGGI